MKPIAVILFLFFCGFSFAQEAITSEELKNHIQFLTADSLEGRYPGTRANQQLVTYLASDLKSNNIDVLIQDFEARLRKDSSVVTTQNVIGFIEGNDPDLKNEAIVLGAHYDHLGTKEGAIFHGADDNASGTAVLLEIAEKLQANRQDLKRGVILIAFGAEEQGLLGSQAFVNNPPIALSNIKLMINMDMLGHLNADRQVFMGGAGTFPNGVQLMNSLGKSLGLNPVVHAGSVGGSDHVSFYQQKIAVLGMHTGGHPHYHKPSDTLDKLNFPGMLSVADYIYQSLLAISNQENLSFIPQDE